jgi:pyruvate carboxylase
VKTIPFCQRHSPTFLEGQCTTRFIDQTPELSSSAASDWASKLLTFAAEITVNGFPASSERIYTAPAGEPESPYNHIEISDGS